MRDAAAAPSSGKLSWLPGRFKRERGFRALGDNDVVGEGVGELVGADLAGFRSLRRFLEACPSYEEVYGVSYHSAQFRSPSSI